MKWSDRSKSWHELYRWRANKIQSHIRRHVIIYVNPKLYEGKEWFAQNANITLKDRAPAAGDETDCPAEENEE